MSVPARTVVMVAARERQTVMGQVAGVASVAVFVAFLAGLLQPTLPNPLLLDAHTAWMSLCYAFGIAVLVSGWMRGHRWHVPPFDYALCAYLAFVLLTWTTSVDRARTGVAVARLLGQIAVYCAARVLVADWPALGRILVAAFVVRIAALEWTAFDYHLRSGLAVRLMEYPSLEWNGREGLGTLAAVQFALLLGIWQGARRRLLQLGAILLIAGCVVELLFLYSRAPWISAIAVLGIASVRSVRVGGVRRYVLAVALVTIVVGAVATPYQARLARNAAGLERMDEGGLEFRLVLWRNALDVIRQHALVGVGLDNFIVVHHELYPEPLPERPETRTAHPHNMFLQQLAEVGVFGGLAYIALWGGVLWAGWRIARRATAAYDVGSSLFYALVALMVVNLGENMFLEFVAAERARLHTIAWMLAGFTVAEWSRTREAEVKQHAPVA